MCGIFGSIGNTTTKTVLFEGLRRMEYRGYDSSGICVIEDGEFVRRRAVGHLTNLEPLLEEIPEFNCGIAHTRWATHGAPTVENAHPHVDSQYSVAVVHNGIIENETEIRDHLRQFNGSVDLASDTDSELIAHLLSLEFEQAEIDASACDITEIKYCWKKVIDRLEGSFALAAIIKYCPDIILFARRFAPLIIASNGERGLLASDVACMVGLTSEVQFIEDGDWGVLRTDGVEIFDETGASIERETAELEWQMGDAELGGYPTFMLKEIHEQPRVVRDCLRGRLHRESIHGVDIPHNPRLIRILACGTAYNAGLISRYYIEKLAGVPVILDHAHEFRYGAPSGPKALVIGISQSGETADTLAGINAAKERGYPTLGIVNVETSTLARSVDSLLGIRAGPEIGVASTKAFTGQVLGGLLVALRLGELNNRVHPEDLRYFNHEARLLPTAMERMLSSQNIKTGLWEAQQMFIDKENAFFLGRNTSYPIALEGALKLKEISYIHAEGYAGGELKHGPLALVEQDTPVVVIASEGDSHKKLCGNAKEVSARGAKVLFITHFDDETAEEYGDLVIRVPKTHELLQPLMYNVITQLLALQVAEDRGRDVDRPRNLAKSVTVE